MSEINMTLLYHGDNQAHEFWDSEDRAHLILRDHHEHTWRLYNYDARSFCLAQNPEEIAGRFGLVLDYSKVWQEQGEGFQLIQPKFRHECESCVFLGHFVDDGKHYDLHFCCHKPKIFLHTPIARFGNGRQDYLSGLLFGDRGSSPPLLAAIAEAKKRRLNDI